MTTRIPVLYCIDALARGGTELQLTGLIDRLDRTRFEPHLLTMRNEDESLIPQDCPHLELRVHSLASRQSAAALARTISYLRRHRIRVVQTFFQDATIFGALAARLAGVPVRLVSFRDLGFWRTPAQDRNMRIAYRVATGFVANSRAVREHFCAGNNLCPSKFVVIPNGLDVSRFTFREPIDAPKIVGLLGNLNREVKRPDLFIEAAGVLAPRYPELRWELIGDGHLRPGLEARVKELGIAEKVIFHGRVDDVSPLLNTWDVGVLCSDSEGFANAILEYMLCGCAVVATETGGNPEMITQEETGLLVPCGSAGSLTSALDLLLRDYVRRRRYVIAAHTEVKRRYSWEGCVNAHEDMYERALTGSSNRTRSSVIAEA